MWSLFIDRSSESLNSNSCSKLHDVHLKSEVRGIIFGPPSLKNGCGPV